MTGSRCPAVFWRCAPFRGGRLRLLAAAVGLALIGSACATQGTPSPFQTSTAGLPSPTSTPSPTTVTPSPSPTATPVPPLSLDLPTDHDSRKIRFSFLPSVPTTKGRGKVTVTITNLSSTMIKEVVLRWPTPVDRIVYFAPFTPSTARLRGALVQEWTKWVVGPGEMGEPAGTTSLGWGPILAGRTISFQLVATRKSVGSVSFDLQVLDREAVLTGANSKPAEARVRIP